MKNINKEHIINYLKIASKYSEKFYPLYMDRTNIKKIEWFEYFPHWVWIFIKDFKKNIEIDFDYFNYEQNWIKYFDPWKLNIYIESLWKKNIISDESLIKLEKEWFIKKYQNYYKINS